MPLDPGRVPPSAMDLRQWSRFASESGIQASAHVIPFTPTFSGFAAPPLGGPMYYQDFGEIVVMWTEVGFSGTSNSTFFSMTGVPSEILPVSGTRVVPVVVEDNSIPNKMGAAVVSSGGVAFSLGDVPVGGGAMSFLLGGWTSGSGKGLPPGALIVYAK